MRPTLDDDIEQNPVADGKAAKARFEHRFLPTLGRFEWSCQGCGEKVVVHNWRGYSIRDRTTNAKAAAKYTFAKEGQYLAFIYYYTETETAKAPAELRHAGLFSGHAAGGA